MAILITYMVTDMYKLSGKIQVNKEREKEQMMKTVLQRKGVFKVNISIFGV